MAGIWNKYLEDELEIEERISICESILKETHKFDWIYRWDNVDDYGRSSMYSMWFVKNDKRKDRRRTPEIMSDVVTDERWGEWRKLCILFLMEIVRFRVSVFARAFDGEMIEREVEKDIKVVEKLLGGAWGRHLSILRGFLRFVAESESVNYRTPTWWEHVRARWVGVVDALLGELGLSARGFASDKSDASSGVGAAGRRAGRNSVSFIHLPVATGSLRVGPSS
jgi:hypothetical protein